MISAARGLQLADGDEQVIIQQTSEYNDNAPRALPRLTSVQRLIDIGHINKSNQDFLDNLASDFVTWKEHYDTLFSDPDSAKDYMSANGAVIEQLFSNIRKKLKHVRTSVEKTEASLRAEGVSAVALAIDILLFGGGLSIILSMSIAWYFSGILIAPLQRLRQTMENIASGDGDLTQRIDIAARDEVGQLANQFNIFIAKIHGTVNEVVQASSALRTEVRDIQKNTGSISDVAEAQQLKSQHVVSVVDQMSASCVESSEHANQAAEASSIASDESKSAQTIFLSTVTSIDQLAADIQQAGEVIHQLVRNVVNISSILNIIRGIADQTNLLALNAAIEAARAGEQGRGFAVVADEVRSLASKTQDCTGDIQEMIEKLEQGAKDAVAAMDNSSKGADHSVKQAREANESLLAIGGSINIISTMNSQISISVKEQSTMNNSVNENVREIAEAGDNMLGIVSSAETACTILAEQCKRLDGIVLNP